MIFRTVFFRICFVVFLTLVIIEMKTANAVAQFDSESFYEVIAEVPVLKNNFVQAREKAVKIALKSALEQDLREFLGDDEYERNRREIQRIFRKSEKYVKSYRFLEANDDPVKLVSQVKLEVVLFRDAVNNYLSRIGVATDLKDKKQVVILINESSLSSDGELLFWETLPISETSLTRNLVEEGIPVVRRSFIRYAVSEETVRSAIKGDLSAAVSIGLKVGADIVIVGNATSTLLTDEQIQSQQAVRVAISIKVVSSHQSTLIAAKSDFATASGNKVLAGELNAFHRAGKKLTDFLIPVIQKHWESGNEKKEVKQSAPAPKTDFLHLPWGDL